MPLRFAEDGNYTLGMIRDVPSWKIPEGGVFDAQNILFDVPGVARQRGGNAQTSAVGTAIGTSIGFVRSDDATQIEEFYALDGKAGGLTRMSLATGGLTTLGTPSPTGIVGRPARHFGFLTFPVNANAQVTHGAVSVAGITTNTSFTNAVASTLTAGNPQITLTGADVTTNVKVGAVVRSAFVDGLAANWVYWGRVVSVDTTKLFTVWPTPTVTGTAAIGSLTTGPSRASAAGGTCAASFQNRLLIGNTMDLSASSPVRNDRRVIYSILPTETNGGNIGATFVDSGSWPRLNYFDVPGADPIVAIEPVSDNQLLILTTTRPFVFSGNLTTQISTTSPTITFDISEVPGDASCVSGLGVARSNKGIIWAGYGGIYAWNGREPVDLTDKKINTYWRSLVTGSNFAVHGAAHVRGHYIVTGTSGGSLFALCVNLTNLAWTRLTNVDMFMGLPRPTDPSQVYGLRWWDQTGSAPTFTNSQTFRLGPMFDPSNPNIAVDKVDSDSTGVNVSVTSRAICGDPETQKIQQRATVRYSAAISTGTQGILTVTAQTKMDLNDTDTAGVRTLGTLSEARARTTVTGATNASPIVVALANHRLQDGDWVDINGILGNLNANGRWRILVVNASSFSLIGSSGSGAYVSGGVVRKVGEQDFLTSVVDPGQAISFNITSTSLTNDFQLQGFRVAYLERAPVMSA